MSEAPPEVVVRNIRAILEARHRNQARRTRAQRIADRITAFTGSMTFAIVHAVLFAGWIVINSGVFSMRPWDPFPFVLLAMWAAVEAIFLTTFVLMSQNRMAEVADQRAELDLQINLLAEHEVTHVLGLVDEIAKRLGIERREEVEALKAEVAPESLLDEISEQRTRPPSP